MYVIFFYTNNINMIYVIGLITGIFNGLFASGAGQIITIYLIFLKKLETHISRNISISIISISSVIALFNYYNNVKFKILDIIIISIISIIGGVIGNNIMTKINSYILNIIAGIIIVILSIYGVINL